MDFVAYHTGEALAGKTMGQYYLLDGALCVISAKTGGENVAFGTSFFDLFPAVRAVREEIAAYLHSYPQEVLLTLCGRTPVLFVGTVYAQTGLVLAVLPEGELKKTLASPAAFHHVPAHVCVSISAQMRYKAHDEEAFAAAARYLSAISAPFALAQSASGELSAWLSSCTQRLSMLLQAPLSCDLSGLPAMSVSGVQAEFALGVILATLMAAGRAASDAEVRLCALFEGAPTLYLEYTRNDLSHTPRELEPLLSCAAARGAVLDVVYPLEDPYLVQVRACIGVVELSAQGVRERHRFLEGKSPLSGVPVSHAIPPAFSEFSFD